MVSVNSADTGPSPLSGEGLQSSSVKVSSDKPLSRSSLPIASPPLSASYDGPRHQRRWIQNLHLFLSSFIVGLVMLTIQGRDLGVNIIGVQAWWDVGHMLLAGVAKLQLTDEEIQKLEGVLQEWEPLYPGMSTIPASAVWADHIKCTHPSEICEGLAGFDDVQMFDKWHYEQIPSNPQHIDLRPLYRLFPLPQTGAGWTLRTIYDSLERSDHPVSNLQANGSSRYTPPDRCPVDFVFPSFSISSPSSARRRSSPMPPTSSCPEVGPPSSIIPRHISHQSIDLQPWWPAHVGRPNRHISPPITLPHPRSAEWSLRNSGMTARPASPILLRPNLNSSDVEKGEVDAVTPVDDDNVSRGLSSSPNHVGTEFSLNTQLRLLIHIFGDIHQPLHTTDTFSNVFIDGDEGGTKIHLDQERQPQVEGLRSLHCLWDAGGGLYRQAWPSFTQEEVMNEASVLASTFPPESFGDRLKNGLCGLDFDAVLKDTHQVALSHVYTEFDWNNFSYEDLPYCPSDCYLKTTAVIAQQQLTLGGYRLAVLLREIAKHLPEVRSTKSQTYRNTNQSGAVEERVNDHQIPRVPPCHPNDTVPEKGPAATNCSGKECRDLAARKSEPTTSDSSWSAQAWQLLCAFPDKVCSSNSVM